MRWVSDRSTGPSLLGTSSPVLRRRFEQLPCRTWSRSLKASRLLFFRGLSGWNMDNFPNTPTSNMNQKIRYFLGFSHSNSPSRREIYSPGDVHGSFTLRRYRVWITREIYCTEIGDVDAHAKPPEAWLVHKRTRKTRQGGRQAPDRVADKETAARARAPESSEGGEKRSTACA